MSTANIPGNNMSLNEDTILSYNKSDNPLIAAPLPFSIQLESATAPIWSFDPVKGIDFSSAGSQTSFNGIDIDIWIKQMLKEVDALTEQYAAAIATVDKAEETSYLPELLANKAALADVIKARIAFVFDGDAGATDEIKKVLGQQLLTSLSSVYNINAGLQYLVNIAADTFSLVYASVAAADQKVILLRFTGDVDSAKAADITNYTVSDGLTVVSASCSIAQHQLVTLTLSDNIITDKTTVSVKSDFVSDTGKVINAPLTIPVNDSITASSVIEGAVTQAQAKDTDDATRRAKNISFIVPKIDPGYNSKMALPFLLASPEQVGNQAGAVIPNIDLNPLYKIVSIANEWTATSQNAKYSASSKIALLNTPDNLKADLGNTKLPVILRAIPYPLSLKEQDARYGVPLQPDDISKTLNWDYAINYVRDLHYPQDELLFSVTYNIPDKEKEPAPTKLKSGTVSPEFNALAQFIAVLPGLQNVFSQNLYKISDTTADEQKIKAAAIGLDAFCAVVKKVVTALQTDNVPATAPAATPATNTEPQYDFVLQEGIGADDALIITITAAAEQQMNIPTVEIAGYETKAYGTASDSAASYCFAKDGVTLKAVDGQAITDRAVMFNGLNILAVQNAQSTVTIQRNANLVPGKKTAAGFIYTSGSSSFPNVFRPVREYADNLNIPTTQEGGKKTDTLRNHLSQLYNAIVKNYTPDTLILSLDMKYHYEISPGLNTEIPVLLSPLATIDIKNPLPGSPNLTINDFLDKWSQGTLEFFNNVAPNIEHGALHIDLTLFSTYTGQPSPLLQLLAIELPLKNVTDFAATATDQKPAGN